MFMTANTLSWEIAFVSVVACSRRDQRTWQEPQTFGPRQANSQSQARTKGEPKRGKWRCKAKVAGDVRHVGKRECPNRAGKIVKTRGIRRKRVKREGKGTVIVGCTHLTKAKHNICFAQCMEKSRQFCNALWSWQDSHCYDFEGFDCTDQTLKI